MVRPEFDRGDITGRIRPSGMTYARAYEIAADVVARAGLGAANARHAVPFDELSAGPVNIKFDGKGFHVNSGRKAGAHLPPEKVALVISLLSSPLSANEIAIRAGVSSRLVDRYRKKFNIPSTFYRPTKKRETT